MSGVKQMIDDDALAERLQRGWDEVYYGQEWPSESECAHDAGNEYHVLFNELHSPVQSVVIYAASFEDCERQIQERYPNAAYWEIGF